MFTYVSFDVKFCGSVSGSHWATDSTAIVKSDYTIVSTLNATNIKTISPPYVAALGGPNVTSKSPAFWPAQYTTVYATIV